MARDRRGGRRDAEEHRRVHAHVLRVGQAVRVRVAVRGGAAADIAEAATTAPPMLAACRNNSVLVCQWLIFSALNDPETGHVDGDVAVATPSPATTSATRAPSSPGRRTSSPPTTFST